LDKTAISAGHLSEKTVAWVPINILITEDRDLVPGNLMKMMKSANSKKYEIWII